MQYHHRVFIAVLVFLLAAGSLAGCSAQTATMSRADVPAPAAWPTSDWQSSTPEEQGIDSARLAALLDVIRERSINLHSLLIIRNGVIVLEAYADPYGPDVRHTVESNTKSVVGALIGIAIDQGLIAGADAKVADFYPGHDFSGTKKSITLAHLLSMTSGLDCADMTPAAQGMYQADDWVRYLVDLPAVDRPGKGFVYCSGGVHILSDVLQQATGRTAREFANRNLFSPLGIAEVGEADWHADPQGRSNGIAGLYLTPRELAKFGMLYLHRGMWDGQQVVPAAWVDRSTASLVKIGKSNYTAGLSRDFGYLFSIFPEEKFYGYIGMAGQNLLIAPEQNLIVVMNSGLQPGEEGSLLPLMSNYILPAVQGERLPASVESQERLSSALERFTGQRQPAQPLPEPAVAASGRVYVFDENPLGWKELSFTFTEGADVAQVIQDGIPLQVGLDNRYRLNEVPGSRPVGMHGRWVTSEIFKLWYMIEGEFAEQTITVQFKGDEIQLSVLDYRSGGTPFTLTARSK